MRKLIGAIEAGGTKFICEVTDEQGITLADSRIPTTTPEQTLQEVLNFFAVHARHYGNYCAFGIAAFGPLDLQEQSSTFGHILSTPKPGWSGTDLISPLEQRFNCPVALDTDVNAAALAEALHGAGRGCHNVVYVTVGTGIGGGLCIGGSSVSGMLHPEMGHVRVLRHPQDTAFPGCCPFHEDCLEGLACGPAILQRYGCSLEQLPQGHPAYQIIGYYLGQLASTIILLLSPQRIIFGGGVMQNAGLYQPVREAVTALLNGYAGLGDAVRLQAQIIPPGLGQRAGIEGAIALARKKLADSAAQAPPAWGG